MLFGLTGCDYEGIDGSVFGSAAEAAKRPPRQHPGLKPRRGWLAMNVLILFGLGFLAGRSWERLLKGASAAKGSTMHFHADHTLFFEAPLTVARCLSLGLTLCVVTVNAAAQGTACPWSAQASGSSPAPRPPARARALGAFAAWTITLVAIALVAGAALGGDHAALSKTTSRIACGVIWVLWLGTQLDWASLAHPAQRAGADSVVSALDHALMHGALTQNEWGNGVMQRECLGRSRLPLRSWGRLLGEGALGGFLRLERAEENALLRGGSARAPSSAESIQLSGVTVEREGHRVLTQVGLRRARECVLCADGAAQASRASCGSLQGSMPCPGHHPTPWSHHRVARCAPLEAGRPCGAPHTEPRASLHREHRGRRYRLGPEASRS